MKAPKLADRIAKITPEVTKVKEYPMKVTLRPVLPVAIVAASFLICWLTPMSGAQERGQDVKKTVADAEVSLRRRDYEGVISAAQQALIADPNSGVAYRFLYEAYLYRRDFDRSNQARDNALRLLKAPNDAMEYEARGAAYLFTDRQRAIADYSEAIRLDPKYAVAYSNRGLAYAYKNEYDRAIADYNEAIRLDPKYVEAYYNRGLAYDYKNEYDRAIAEFKEAIRLDPKYAVAYYNRGLTYADKNE